MNKLLPKLEIPESGVSTASLTWHDKSFRCSLAAVFWLNPGQALVEAMGPRLTMTGFGQFLSPEACNEWS
jgi:hypothetical protein